MSSRLSVQALLVLLLACTVSGQNLPSQHNHNVDTAGMIDGETHPELIPDATAYRLYMLTVSTMPNATTDEHARQASHIAALRLHNADRITLTTILTDFKSRYSEMISEFNASATAAIARGEAPDIKTFLQKRNDLVQFVMTTLRLSLSPDGMKKLDSHIQLQKRSMKVDEQEAQ